MQKKIVNEIKKLMNIWNYISRGLMMPKRIAKTIGEENGKDSL